MVLLPFVLAMWMENESNAENVLGLIVISGENIAMGI